MENILLDNLGKVKICDFGVSVAPLKTNTTGTHNECVGTPAYMAPEVVATSQPKKVG